MFLLLIHFLLSDLLLVLWLGDQLRPVPPRVPRRVGFGLSAWPSGFGSSPRRLPDRRAGRIMCDFGFLASGWLFTRPGRVFGGFCFWGVGLVFRLRFLADRVWLLRRRLGLWPACRVGGSAAPGWFLSRRVPSGFRTGRASGFLSALVVASVLRVVFGALPGLVLRCACRFRVGLVGFVGALGLSRIRTPALLPVRVGLGLARCF